MGPGHLLSDQDLHKALEFALAIAQAGQRLRPPLPVPAALRPLLKFQKVSAPALAVVRRTLDDDDEFRQRVASVATEELVDAIGLAWLARAEGWQDQVAELLEQQRPVDDDERERPQLLRRLQAAEAGLARSRAELAGVLEEHRKERARRDAAVHTERRALARVDELEATLARRDGEIAALRDQLEAAQRTAARERLRAEQGEQRLVALGARGEELTRQVESLLAQRQQVDGVGAPERADPALAEALGSLRQAAGALSALAGALERSAEALGTGMARPVQVAARSNRARRTRQPQPIPGGLYGDDVEVVRYLSRVANMVLVVDGYNVAKSAWPSLSLAEQRRCLLDALEEMVRRVLVRVQVVFDGAEVVGAHGSRQLVHVRFSPAGVLADDVIRDTVAGLADDVPVTVVSSDAALVASVRAMGANTLTTPQFVAALGR
jgi:predicted RNA-binding protein with PIN domain